VNQGEGSANLYRMTNWALAVTAPNLEHAVSTEMVRRSLEHIIFMMRWMVVWRGRLVERFRPAFPGYVFIRHADYHDVVGIDRVIYVVPKDLPPEIVPDEIVDSLVQRCGGSFVFPIADVPARFTRGDKVIISGCGPAAGHIGIYESSLGNGRACVLFDWMGQHCPVDVDERDLEKKLEKKLLPKIKKRKHKRGRRGRGGRS
jgi:transcription antitermination factor NusG